MSLNLYANPYDTAKAGFYFKSFEDYEKKEAKHPSEEFEIDFIDGDDVEQMLFKAMQVNQSNIEEYFEVVDDFDEDDAIAIEILTYDMGYSFEDAMDKKEDLVVYGEFDSDEDFAMEYVDGIGSLEDALGDNIQNYFDYEAFGRDVRLEGGCDCDPDEGEECYICDDTDDRERGEELADDIGWEGVGKNNLEQYFNWKGFARDLMFDMSKIGSGRGGVYYDPNSI